jgi:hypothetical protein
VCYEGRPSSQFEEDEAKADADRIPAPELSAILAQHRAGDKTASARLRRGFAYLAFRFYRKREEYLRRLSPKKKRPMHSADELLGKLFMDMVEQLDRCADPENESFTLPAEQIEGFIVGQLVNSDKRLTDEEKSEIVRWVDPHGRVAGTVCDSHTTETEIMTNEHRKMLMPELRRIQPFAKTEFERRVIGLALSDFDVEEIREALNYGVTTRQITDALETIRDRADNK